LVRHPLAVFLPEQKNRCRDCPVKSFKFYFVTYSVNLTYIIVGTFFEFLSRKQQVKKKSADFLS
jgi:hypothetical protein